MADDMDAVAAQRYLTIYKRTLTVAQRAEEWCGRTVKDLLRDEARFQIRWIFGKLYCAFRDKIVTKVRMLIWRHCCVLYDPISHEMHVVQMFNMVIGWKHTLKRPFYIIFMLKKPCLKVQILQYKFLDWKWPPPLSELFRKFIRFGNVRHPLGKPPSTKSAVFFNIVQKGGGPCSKLLLQFFYNS